MTDMQIETGEEPATSTAAPPQGGVSVSGDAAPIAGGGETPPPAEPKAYWPDDWRHKIAEHVSAGDERAYQKELKRLEKLGTTPADIYNAYRSIESTWSSRNFVKLPGKDAKPEDIAEFHKALGVPDTPQDYLKDLQFDDGLTLGEWDQPAVEEFAAVMHEAGAPKDVVKQALHWYLMTQEEQAAALDEADDSFRRVSEQALKNEFGNAYRRYTNNIANLFAAAPGGTDLENDEGVFARLLGGRTADGHIIGNDPDIIRWMATLANNLNPAGAVVDDAPASGRSIEEEISALEQRMKDDRRAYFKDEAAQARYRELLTARDKIRARAR